MAPEAYSSLTSNSIGAAFGPSVDEPILEDSGGLNCSTTRFPHANHQGSIIAPADCGEELD